MIVSLENIWRYPGVNVHIKDLDIEDIEDGFYKFISNETDALMFLDKNNQLVYIDEYEDSDIITAMHTDVKERLQNLIDGTSIEMLGLIKDGWVQMESTSYGTLDLTPYMDKLSNYIDIYVLLSKLDE